MVISVAMICDNLMSQSQSLHRNFRRSIPLLHSLIETFRLLDCPYALILSVTSQELWPRFVKVIFTVTPTDLKRNGNSATPKLNPQKTFELVMVMVCKSWIMIDFLILPFEQFSGVQFHQDFAGDTSGYSLGYSDLAAVFCHVSTRPGR